MANKLYYGDNLDVMRDSIPSESIDLVYLDPPFNSNANYNVLFKAPSGEQSAAQIEAFTDSWHWNDVAERAYDEVLTGPHSDASIMIKAMRTALGENDMMAYLAMMSVRLIELHRVLKPTGSLYLHCDPTASHYLKLILDGIFGPRRFLNEITWRRTSAHNDGARYGRISDRILFYSKSKDKQFRHVGGEYSDEQLARFKYVEGNRRFKAENLTANKPSETRTYTWRGTHPGANRQWRFSNDELERLWKEGRILTRRDGCPRTDGLKEYLDESEDGPALQDLWTDIDRIGNTSSERLGYPTQKPVSLLERIIACSTTEDQVVLDPFCGCGTTIHAAQKLGRPWIGIDVTHLAIGLVERRLREAFPGIKFEVHGLPTDLDGARDLALRDKHEFQKWITGRVGAQPYKGGKKGMDRGVDGFLHFRDAEKKAQIGIVSVKGGNVKSGDVRDLKGTMERENAALGLFLTLNEPSKEMVKEAAAAGLYETGGMKVPKLQILTAKEIIEGKKPVVPFGFTEGFKVAAKEIEKKGKALDLSKIKTVVRKKKNEDQADLL